MNAKLYAFMGDGGYTFSAGFNAYIDRLGIALGVEVLKIADSGRNTNVVAADMFAQPIERIIIFVGYSLGANGAAWCQYALKARHVDLLVGFDPTRNGPPLSMYPIGWRVKRCLCFQQTAWWFPSSMFYGRGLYVRASDGPQIEVTQVQMDHLWVQSSKRLQDICTAAVRQTIGDDIHVA